MRQNVRQQAGSRSAPVQGSCCCASHQMAHRLAMVSLLHAFLHSRPRVIAHLEEKSPRCKFVVLSLPTLSPEACAALDADDATLARQFRREGRTRVAGNLPAWRADGPLHPSAEAVGVSWLTGLKTQSANFYPVHACICRFWSSFPPCMAALQRRAT